jgi:uncharacterized DUF497 family protein
MLVAGCARRQARLLALHGRRPKSTVRSNRRLTTPRKTTPIAASIVCHHPLARVFEDANCLLIPTFREEDSEDRCKVIWTVDRKFWTAVHVRHGDTMRFISVRGSTDGEEKQYLA